LDAAMMRASNLIGARFADPLDLALLQRAQQLGLQRHLISPTSSMKSVPRCASSKRPTRPDGAGEGALRVPEQLGFGQGSGIAAALKATNRWSARGLLWWIVRAMSSLPVPVSP
jgi:hypothetical protein